jgi:chromosome segregation ATPase
LNNYKELGGVVMKGIGIILSSILAMGSIGTYINEKEEEINILTNEKIALIEQVEDLNKEKKRITNSKEYTEEENERLKESITKLKEENKQLKKDKQTETEKLNNKIDEINNELMKVKYEKVLLKAEVNESTEGVNTTDNSAIVYANGGRSSSNKYHKSSNAHGMEGAIKMTETQAKNSGYVACKKCW